MKKQILFLIGLITSISLLADVPQGISHQAVMRDAENNLIVESPIGLQVSIIQGTHDGNAVYVETHQVTSNQNGLITYIIGDGNAVDGVFQDINWGSGPYWLETKADPTGGENYSITGVTKFFSVPYSMYAEFAGHAETFAGLDALLARIEALEEALDVEDPEFTCGDNITFTYKGQQVTYGTVSRGGLCWLDRNLGASRVPISSTDAEGYGDLFQWGRLDDGHQARTSSTTPGPVNQDVPGHGNFITVNSSPYDWRSPQNNNLWQGEDGINNPCPPGWRVPTESELNAERQSWSPNNSAGAYASALKWPVGGYRNFDGALFEVGSYGFVWSSSAHGTNAKYLYFYSGLTSMSSVGRANGMSVRCVRDN